MKALLIVSVLCLLVAAPSVSAADGPCPDTELKQCVGETVSPLLGGCNPWYNYFRECDPTS